MKTIILGGGMFGFAIAKHLGDNNPETDFFLYERDDVVSESLKTKRENPFFFSGVKLPENIFFEDDIESNIGNYDLIIVAIPAQFVVSSITAFKNNLKPGVTILNLSKGINNETLKTIGDGLEENLAHPQPLPGKEGSFYYNYAVLSGGMIAGELVEKKILGADIAVKLSSSHGGEVPGKRDGGIVGENLKNIFHSDELKINLTSASTKSVELFGALKNIIAISIGYYMGQGLAYSSLGYYLCKLLEEEKALITILGGGEYFEFSDYSLGGDIVATCFGNSRNRYLGELLGKGNSIESALEIMKQENKTAEGYHTLKGVRKIVEEKDGFEEIKKISEIIFGK